MLPWKIQKPDGVVYASYDRLMDPLPPPPEGLRWAKVRVEDAADGATTRWELVPKAAGALGADDDDVREQAPLDSDYVEHVVMPDDTVMGLRLRYKISMPELRKHNDFFGERFEVCDVLRIPVAGREEHVLKNRQRPTKQVLAQRFKSATRCECEQTTQYYMEVGEWNLRRALEEYREDKRWEEEHQAVKEREEKAARAMQAPATAPPAGPPPRYSSVFPQGRPKRRGSPARAMSEFVADVFSTSSHSVRTPLLRDYDDFENQDLDPYGPVAVVAGR